MPVDTFAGEAIAGAGAGEGEGEGGEGEGERAGAPREGAREGVDEDDGEGEAAALRERLGLLLADGTVEMGAGETREIVGLVCLAGEMDRFFPSSTDAAAASLFGQKKYININTGDNKQMVIISILILFSFGQHQQAGT